MHPPEMQNPRRVDRHPQARVELRRFNEEALNTFDNIKISEICKTNFDGARKLQWPPRCMRPLRRKAVAS